ncbi:MAG TPA: hypothetical protein VML19_30455 [Verrucomicrobiae bacterium]|nr:hypothetical protein [Verrucomicrobiae bacterium]
MQDQSTPPGILFDSDIGRTIDAALALAMLHNLGRKGRLIATGLATSSLEAAQFCDAVERFYQIGQRISSNRGVGIGYLESSPKLIAAPMLTVPLAMKNAQGSPIFRTSIQSVDDTADVRILFRNVLTNEENAQATALLAGPATDFAATLALNGAAELVAAKIRLLVLSAGSFADGPADPRIQAGIPAARQLFARWPSPIIAIGTETAAAIPFPGHSIETDFSWAAAHPIAESYRAFHTMPYDAPAPAALAALYLHDESADYFHLSPPGRIDVSDDGRTKFTPSDSGKHRVLTIDPSAKDRVQQAMAALASARPAAPRFRGRG